MIGREGQVGRVGQVGLLVLIAIAACRGVLHAHSGPPFPILEDRIAGAYQVSVWADPDATDDRSPAGQFWIALRPSQGGALSSTTRVEVAVRPLDRPGAEQAAAAEPIKGDPGRQFVALLMDHEGPFGVRVTIDGPLGRASLETSTDATYDLRPSRALMALFVLPFVLAGFVWGKLLIKRKMQPRGGPNGQSRD